MSVWFTSDQHYNHSKIISLMNRPFSSVEEMNDTLIYNHNQVVKPGDKVYHLGDFAWTTPDVFLERLAGNHYLIKGNHDFRVKTDSFIWTKDTKQLEIDGTIFWLSHYAHRVWPLSHKGSFHLYGHSHGMMDSLYGNWGRSMDVGVDNNNFRPIHYEEVIDKLKEYNYSWHHPE